MKELDSSWQSSINDGEYRRKDSVFRHWITSDGSAGITGDSGFKAEPDRYHLYVSLACPWAHRTLIFRKLKSLESLISVSVVHPDMHQHGWTFKHNAETAKRYGTTGDPLYGSHYLLQRYAESSTEYRGNITVPVLWDKHQNRIVNNESAEIIRMFNNAFNDLTGNSLDYYPDHLRKDIDEINTFVYHNINNGVYKTGFATTQQAYEKNCLNLFNALNEVETRLSKQRYLASEQITEADWRLFTTLLRFDSVYHTHFKCNIRQLKDYENIYNYLLELYQHKDIADTVNMAHIKRHYYASHLAINPYGIVPLGHEQDWSKPHNRG
jgi:putative glutathione S-transferase